MQRTALVESPRWKGFLIDLKVTKYLRNMKQDESSNNTQKLSWYLLTIATPDPCFLGLWMSYFNQDYYCGGGGRGYKSGSGYY